MDYTFKGTKGPWVYQATSAGKHKAVDQHGFSIATTPGYNKENMSNARLIAAAPDLLEACKFLLATMLENPSIEGPYWDKRIALTKQVIHRALNIQP